MADQPPTSVLLPTVGWTTVIEEIDAQLEPSDELLVICDDDDDPIAEAIEERSLSESVRLVVAGRPEACSGKANAIAAGMEAAGHDRIVWTDDDFHHPPDWLEGLHAEYERNGPTTELPFFVGRDPLAVLLEPLYVIGGPAALYAGNIAWAGSLIFDRNDLPDEGSFLCDLRQSMSDDGLLTEYVDITPVKRTRRVPVGGTIRETLERHVRFTKIVRFHDPRSVAGHAVLAVVLTAAAVVVPALVALGVSLALAALYAAFGLRRPTFVLAFPALLVSVPLLAYALVRRTFVWGGRRYRWSGRFDVEVLD